VKKAGILLLVVAFAFGFSSILWVQPKTEQKELTEKKEATKKIETGLFAGGVSFGPAPYPGHEYLLEEVRPPFLLRSGDRHRSVCLASCSLSLSKNPLIFVPAVGE
jgi:hypothetical protein